MHQNGQCFPVANKCVCEGCEQEKTGNEAPGGASFGVFGKLEFGGESPLTIRAWCSTFRYCPNPLGIVTAEQFDKLEFVKAFLSENTYSFFHSMGK